MGLLCALGRHRPEPWPRWNAGYYFSRCGRCGRDLVRTTYGSWYVPKGCKIVWQTTPPENAVIDSKTSKTGATPSAKAPTTVTIEEMLRTLGSGIPPKIEGGDGHESAIDPQAPFATAKDPAQPVADLEMEESASVSSRIPDFMDDDDDPPWAELWEEEVRGVEPGRSAASSSSETLNAIRPPGSASTEGRRSTNATGN